MSNRVVVAGAGWAGLSTAVRLVQRGLDVHLVESAPQAGGRAREVRLDFGLPPAGEIVLDAGQHLLVGAYRESLELAEVVNAGAAAMTREALRLTDTGGLRIVAPRWPAPLHLMAALAGAQGLAFAERVAAIRLLGGLRLRGWRVLRGETVDALLARHRQPATLVERLWQPLCLAALNTPVEAACAQAFAAVMRDTLGAARAASDFVLPRSTLGELLAHPALAWLRARGARVSLGTTVRELLGDEHGWRLRIDGGAIECTQLVLATPAWVTARLLAPHHARAASLDAFAHESIATVYLAWPQSQAPALPPWILLREAPERGQHGQWLFDRGTQGGLHIAAVVISARGRLGGDDPQGIALGIAQQVVEQLHAPMPGAHRTVTEKRATHLCTPDRPRVRVDEFADALPGLWLAGDYVDPEYPATLEAAVRSGRRTADRVATTRAARRAPATAGAGAQSQAISRA